MYLGAQEASFRWPQELRYLSDFSAGRGCSKAGPRAQLALLCLQARAVQTIRVEALLVQSLQCCV